jgi:hypothetical protein
MSSYWLKYWPVLWLPIVLQGHTNIALHASLSGCFEMDAHDSPIRMKIIQIIENEKNNDKNNDKNNEILNAEQIMIKIMIKR